MPSRLRLISSMATKDVLNELVAKYSSESGASVHLESVGGVDAVRRIRDRESFDLALLASAVMHALVDDGFVLKGTLRVFASSRAALAVRTGGDRPPSIDEKSIKDLIERARTIGISTGPSGVSLVTLLQRWGIYEATKNRIVQAPPGVPVASLIGRSDCDIGFQQMSELLGHPGIEIVGTLPESLIPTTAFSIGVASGSTKSDEAARLVEFLVSHDVAPSKRKFGLEPV